MERQRLASIRVQPDAPVAVAAAATSGQPVSIASSLEEILRRPHVHYPCAVLIVAAFSHADGSFPNMHPHVHHRDTREQVSRVEEGKLRSRRTRYHAVPW